MGCLVLTGSPRREDHIGDLRHTRGALFADSHDDLWIVIVLEVAAGTHDRGPCLADDLCACRNRDRRRHNIHARVEVDDIASGILQYNSRQLDCRVETVPDKGEKLALSKTAWMAAVSSVLPSPVAPCDLTLMNWLAE